MKELCVIGTHFVTDFPRGERTNSDTPHCSALYPQDTYPVCPRFEAENLAPLTG